MPKTAEEVRQELLALLSQQNFEFFRQGQGVVCSFAPPETVIFPLNEFELYDRDGNFYRGAGELFTFADDVCILRASDGRVLFKGPYGVLGPDGLYCRHLRSIIDPRVLLGALRAASLTESEDGSLVLTLVAPVPEPASTAQPVSPFSVEITLGQDGYPQSITFPPGFFDDDELGARMLFFRFPENDS